MTTSQIIKQMEKELFGYNDRGIVSYSDGLAISGYMTPHAICNNCGFSAKGEEAKEMMFGHKGCPKPNGKFIRNDVTVEKLEKSIRTLLESFGEEIINEKYTCNWNHDKEGVERDMCEECCAVSDFKIEQRLKEKEIINSIGK